MNRGSLIEYIDRVFFFKYSGEYAKFTEDSGVSTDLIRGVFVEAKVFESVMSEVDGFSNDDLDEISMIIKSVVVEEWANRMLGRRGARLTREEVLASEGVEGRGYDAIVDRVLEVVGGIMDEYRPE